MGPLIDAFFDRMERPGDSEYHRSQRRLIFTVWVVVSGGWLLAGLLSLDTARIGILQMGQLLGFVASLFGWVSLIFRIPMDYGDHTGLVCLLCALAILAGDVRAASDMRTRSWPLLVLLMDFMLVFKSRQAWQSVVISLTLTYLAVDAVETVVSFGFYEAGRYNEKSGEGRCSCSDPPCEIDPGAAGVGYVVALFIFLMDFYITRSFALRLRDQLNVVDASVNVAERVAQMLAMYATDDARKVLEDVGGCLPVPLLLAYEALLKNLDSYRAFLPDSLLYSRDELSTSSQSEWPRGDVSSRSSSSQPREAKRAHPCRPPPGIDDAGQVAVCFTDVQSSTELWETCPQGMYEGLNIHNGAIRDAYALCNGYEVKTIGDSFMLAFDTIVGALRFGIDAQVRLLRQQWPEDLLCHPLCQRLDGANGQMLWGGLRVRIGANCGPVRVDRNPVTGRCDYFGPTVNVAARLESTLRKGGLVAVSDSVMSELGHDGLEQLGSPVAHDAGVRELKGVRDKIRVWALVPQVLAGRIAVLSSAPIIIAAPTVHTSPAASGTGTPTWGANPVLLGATKPDSSNVTPIPPRRSIHSVCPPRGSLGDVLAGSGRSRVRDFEASRARSKVWDAIDSSERHSSRGSMGSGSIFGRHASLTQPLNPSDRPPRADARLALGLQRQSRASVAAVRLALTAVNSLPDRYSVFVTAASVSADQTQGVVETLLSASVIVSWNASRTCADHAGGCRQFSSSHFRAPCHLGVASSQMLTGNVSAGRRRFAAVVGGAVELATALAEEAERCGDICLATGAMAELSVAAGSAFWAQLWQVCTPAAAPSDRSIVVWEVDARREEKWDLHLDSTIHSDTVARQVSTWSDDGAQSSEENRSLVDHVAVHFRQACTAEPFSAEQTSVLEELRSDIEEGRVSGKRAARLVRRLAAGHVRKRLLPPLWDPDEEMKSPTHLSSTGRGFGSPSIAAGSSSWVGP
eukprot:TRINITY_DN7849_c0_g1_i1.p1 TRINITY_DN7849_c0_g1~~TRINITY_DN7849_c0_g1_i1.p1  ORF type:complete len:995 (+),score=226.89 TRINITY_DN7849_c0_g1_i1:78-2987(+)